MTELITKLLVIKNDILFTNILAPSIIEHCPVNNVESFMIIHYQLVTPCIYFDTLSVALHFTNQSHQPYHQLDLFAIE